MIVRVCRCHHAPCLEADEVVCCCVTGRRLDYWTSGRVSPLLKVQAKHKWCRSFCRRYLPLSNFYITSGGWPTYDCKMCHQRRSAKEKRRRYRHNAAFREWDRARARAYYTAHAEERRAYKRTVRATRKGQVTAA